MADEISARAETPGGRIGWFAAGSVIGAILTSSCCIAPLVLVLLGVSGAWIGNLHALEPFRVYFAAIALINIALGFWKVYFRPRPVCVSDTSCARPRSTMLVKTALWISTPLVILALTTDWWAPYFY